MNRNTLLFWCGWSLVLAGAGFSQERRSPTRPSGHTSVSSDGAGLDEAFTGAFAPREKSAPSAGSGEATLAALTAEGVESFDVETQREFRRLADLPVPGNESATEVIIGPDTRERTYTRTYPARAKVLVTFTGGRCSGALIGPDTVATAGHCVHGGGGGAWKTNVRVYPGRDGLLAPYGSCTAKRLYSVLGWTISGNEEYDYGAIKLNCMVGNVTGWYGFTTANPLGLPSVVQGYPGDKPLEQWFSAHKVAAVSARQIFYLNDTVGGVSGSPVWYDRSGPYLIGIHAYRTHGSGNHALYNHGARIITAVFNNLLAWRNAP